MTELTSKEIHLIKRPVGLPTKDDFAIVEQKFPDLDKGQVLIKNHYFSVDPYMRGRMYDRKSYAPPYQLNHPMTGGCVGEVVESTRKKFKVGDFVLSQVGGWREYYVSNGKDIMKINTEMAPLEKYIGAMGMTGFTAYIGITEFGKIKEGETVFVSGAAGAVGSMVAQIAKLSGCKVIGSAGSDEKIRWLKEDLGLDEAFNYKKVDNFYPTLKKLCPDGIDVYFDNVGGAMLDAALLRMNQHGRVVICGAISQLNKAKPDPIYNLVLAPSKRFSIQGFLISDHQDRVLEFFAKVGKWLQEGKIIAKETVVNGIENSIDAFLGLFSGDNIGKMIVKL